MLGWAEQKWLQFTFAILSSFGDPLLVSVAGLHLRQQRHCISALLTSPDPAPEATWPLSLAKENRLTREP